MHIRSPSDLHCESRLRFAGKCSKAIGQQFERKPPVHTEHIQSPLHHIRYARTCVAKQSLLLSDRSPCEKRGAHRPSGEGTCNHILQVNRHDLEPCRSWCTFPMNALGGSSARALLTGRGYFGGTTKCLLTCMGGATILIGGGACAGSAGLSASAAGSAIGAGGAAPARLCRKRVHRCLIHLCV